MVRNEIFFIHSAGPQGKGQGSTGLIRSLKESLGKNYVLHHPSMPHPENPRYLEWKLALQACLPVGGNKVAIIGHSLGGSVMMKYLSEGLCQVPVAGLFLVAAPYWGLKGWTFDEYECERGFVSKLPGMDRVFVYHSRKDEWVPFSHGEAYSRKLPGAVMRKLTGNEHEFSDGLPVLLKDVLNLSF